MKKSLLSALLATCALSASAQVEVPVDRTKFPDYKSVTNPDPSLLRYGAAAIARGEAPMAPLSERPDHVNNGLTKFFPPVFNQAGGSCGSASRICYMFTHELNSYRDLDGSKPENYYPSHFVWLWTNGNCGKDAFVQFVGVPSAAIYGGQTYSSKFGYQDTANDNFGWSSGYDVWYAAMQNRMERPRNFSVNVGTTEGREAVKNYLWNHNGDPDFRGVGGIVGIGVASGGDWKAIPSTATNDEIGVTGQYYVKRWGARVDHALTVVGYDDRIEFDLNGNGVYGEESADEKGAWIVVNSWGKGWCNGGFIYCPYANAGPAFTHDEDTDTWSFPGNFWQPEIYTVRKNYRPLRTLRVKMDYSRRSELRLIAGISADINAEKAETNTDLVQFQYAGDGNYGNTKPAPEVPMQGRWADGQLHDEPIEIGYDLTDLTAAFDRSQPLKYFFEVDTRSWGAGAGHIYEASIIDYEDDPDGVEFPFEMNGDNVEIKSAGAKTIIAVTVPGQPYYAPANAAISNNMLTWSAPQKSSKVLTGYKITKEGQLIANVDAATTRRNISTDGEGVYSICAVYEGNHESKSVSAHTTVKATGSPYTTVKLENSGFNVPDIFNAKHDKATIEFWIKPTTLTNWNQSIGNWGTFMCHANADGSVTAGWNTGDGQRASSDAKLKVGQWNHVAISVDERRLRIIVDETSKLLTASTASGLGGLGGFGTLTFGSGSTNNHMNGELAELRIWNRAFTVNELKAMYKLELCGDVMPENLLAYYKGDTFTAADGTNYLRDCVGGHHAPLHDSNFSSAQSTDLPLQAIEGEPTVSINVPADIVANIPVEFTAERSVAATSLVWTITGAGIENMPGSKITASFPKAGQYTASVTATSPSGATATANATFTVAASAAPSADFTASKLEAAMGERISFKASSNRADLSYKWEMPGAEPATASGPAVAASYSQAGTYTVTLTVSDADGRTARSNASINVKQIAPEADFTVSPGVVIKGNTVRIADASKWNPSQWSWTVASPAASYISTLKNLDFTPTAPGIYDITLTASNAAGFNTRKQSRALIVTNADSKNGLTFTPAGASVALNKALTSATTDTLVVEWWMNPDKLSTYCQGLGSDNFKIKVSANGALILNIDKDEAYTTDGCVIAGQWHHYAVVYYKGYIKVYRDGELYQTLSRVSTRTIAPMADFNISFSDAPFTGSIDELRVWNQRIERTSTERKEKLQFYANTPLEGDVLTQAKKDGLILYYDFNHSSGDVADRSGNGFTGKRSGFGPEGDAWALSSGVFSLNFGDSENVDVTANYLANYTVKFKTGASVNPTGTRWKALTDWIVENTVYNEETKVTTGAHVDSGHSSCFTITTGWDGFDNDLRNHKVYQTVSLPAGMYTFSAVYDEKEVCDHMSAYLVAAQGSGMPDYDEMADSNADYILMADRSDSDTNSLIFILTEPATVSLGMVLNMSGQACVNLNHFALTRSEINIINTGDSSIDEIAASQVPGANGIFDLQGRRLSRVNTPGIYIINGRKVHVK